MIITQTPLRISFLGGGTDFPKFYKKHNGAVLTAAIDKYVYCIVKERFDNKIYINYSQKEIVSKVSDIKHQLVRESLKKTGITNSIEISFLSDIPSEGSGLGSSASVTVGMLHALYLYKGISVSAEQLAQEACEIEIKNLKKPVGVQDQYIASYGGVSYMEFTDKNIYVKRIDLDNEQIEDLRNHMMVFYTGITRKSSAVLKEQSKKIKDNNNMLKEMTTLAKKGRKALMIGDYEGLGQLVDQSWVLKKGFASNVSNKTIDTMYKKAIEAGAWGGKISGAGGGGFLTIFAPPNKRQEIRKALSGYNQMPIGFSVDGSKVIFNIRR